MSPRVLKGNLKGNLKGKDKDRDEDEDGDGCKGRRSLQLERTSAVLIASTYEKSTMHG